MDIYQNGIIKSDNLFFAASGPQREDTVSIDVHVKWPTGPNKDKFVDIGIWDTIDGGDVDSEETTYYPGGMEERITLGGRQIPNNVTLQRLFRGARDQDELANWFPGAGKALIKVIEQGMDIDGNAYGRPIVWTGRLKRVKPPKRDSNGTAAAMIEIEITPDGVPTA